MLRRNFDNCKKKQYSIQNWIDDLADLKVTKDNIIKWVESVPVLPTDMIPNTPVFLYGEEAGLNNIIIQLMKTSFDKSPIKINQSARTLFSRLNNLDKKDLQKRVKYCMNCNFSNEKMPEVEVVLDKGFSTVRLAVLARNPREPKNNERM